MRTLLLCCLAIFFITAQAQPQPQKWNRQMQLRNCIVHIKAGQFTATTFIEMEFYNPYEQELEGLHQFELKAGQVITAFQLELNGKYRDGTLEEKWKATNAYNRIVGKRIDPALLTMDFKDHYSLRIYPVPAKGSRRITMTIQQLLSVDNGSLQYSLPMNVPDTVSGFHLFIQCGGQDVVPVSLPGIIAGQQFDLAGSQYNLQFNAENIILKNAIRFSIPVIKKAFVCTGADTGRRSFAMRFQPRADTVYNISTKKIIVFWDASASAENRDINKEINFLQRFISWHAIEQITIVPFNYKLLDTAIFYCFGGNSNKWQQYLRNINYTGSTQLGCINFKRNDAELCLLFTDGKNTYGNRRPETNGALVFCISSAAKPDLQAMHQVVGASGGKVIDLNKTKLTSAIELCSKAENWLLSITSSSGKVVTEQVLPLKIDQSILVNGTMSTASDTLIFHYGNNNALSGEEKIVFPANSDCDESSITRLTMLQNFDKIATTHNWENILDFGLQENVVTSNTAFIVLERIEDYIRYNIEAPKDLQEECKLLQYVKSNTRKQREKLKLQDEYNILSNVVVVYNQRMKKMNSDAVAINLERKDVEQLPVAGSAAASAQPMPAEGNATVNIRGLASGTNRLEEVVVVGYGTVRKSSLTASVSYVRSNELQYASSVEQALQGRVPGLVVTQNNTAPNAIANITLRGASAINGNPLFVLDGMPVSGNINDLININDIENITVLRDISSAAIYGSRAANGAIVITSKRGRPFYNNFSYKKYRLADMEDVEYMQDIQSVPANEKFVEYNRLAAMHGTTASFYFDMAQHFFKIGLRKDAFEILMNAAEVGNGNLQVQHAIAYLLEEWKMFAEAIQVYEQLLQDFPGNMSLHRDLAWVYYQQGNYQKSVDILYNAIKTNNGYDETAKSTAKATMLYEMNTIIAAHKNMFDISNIPTALIKNVPMDLRIILDCNNTDIAGMEIKEPGGELISRDKVSKTGGMINGNYNSWNYGNDDPMVYQVKRAAHGKYRVLVDYYYGYYRSNNTPSFVRIKTFKNFGKADQSIEIENIIMDNQYGEIEIGTVNYESNK